MIQLQSSSAHGRVWSVGALCLAVGGLLDARFNPVTVQGEISNFTRAGSGHCYFALKDASGQLRCAMFRRAAGLLGFTPRDGDAVEVRGRLGVYETRGELQLVVESLQRAGQGALFEEFVRRKARLEQEGLFDVRRKRPLSASPRRIGVVSSPGAAAWHDVMSALRRRAPHVPVVLAASSVQGAGAPGELVRALESLYALHRPAGESEGIDVILLVRGGGSIEDLWAFNDETLARTIVRSPVPVVCGVGHETDFTIADFCADLRAPTPTAAAELAAMPRDAWIEALLRTEARLADAVTSRVDALAQRLDRAAARLGQPSALVARQRFVLGRTAQRMTHAVRSELQQRRTTRDGLRAALPRAVRHAVSGEEHRLNRAALGLQLLDPALVLQRGYAWLSDANGNTVTRAAQLVPGEPVRATLADGSAELEVIGGKRTKRRSPTKRAPDPS